MATVEQAAEAEIQKCYSGKESAQDAVPMSRRS